MFLEQLRWKWVEWGFVDEALDATALERTSHQSKSYGYLVIDSSPHADSNYRLCTNIFPNEDSVVYVPKA